MSDLHQLFELYIANYFLTSYISKLHLMAKVENELSESDLFENGQYRHTGLRKDEQKINHTISNK